MARTRVVNGERELATLTEEAWRFGQLAWKLRPYQLGIYETIWGLIEKLRGGAPSADEFRVGTIVASRKIGKSYLESLIAFEFALRHPGAIVRIGAPTAVEARDIFLTEFRKILCDCPPHLRPGPKGVDQHWHFHNGSVLVLKGVDKNPDGLRGPSSDLNFVDEAAYVRRLRYLVESVLYPMTVNTRGPTIMASTLNQSPNAEFNEYYKRCKALKQSAVVDVYSAGFSPEVIEAERKAVNPTTWAIEYECKEERDANQTVVPEWTPERASASTTAAPRSADHPDKPELAHWTRYTAIDWGTVDNTAILTGYYDFGTATLHITGEVIMTGATVTAKSVGAAIRTLEAADIEARPMHQSCQRIRLGDNNVEMLQSLQIDEKLTCHGVSKLTLEAMINNFRMYVKSGRLLIDPACVNLISSIEHAAWVTRAATRRDAPRERSLARSALVDPNGQPLAHFDTLMAAVYMALEADRRKGHNPLPRKFVPTALVQTFGQYQRDNYFVAGNVPTGNNTPKWVTSVGRRR